MKQDTDWNCVCQRQMIRYNETGCRLGMCFARGPMVGEIGRSEIPLRVFSWDSKEMKRCTMKQNADSEWVCREVKCYCGERAGRSDQIRILGCLSPCFQNPTQLQYLVKKGENNIQKREA